MNNTPSKLSSTKNQRIEILDFARSLAILMVILVHTTEKIYSFSDLGEMISVPPLSKIFAFSCFTIGRLGVPIFLFLTGYLMLDRTYDTAEEVFSFWKKKLVPLIISFECWTLLNELFDVIVLKEEFNIIYYLQRAFFLRESNLSHMWYMPMIIGIYFLLPLLSYVLNHFSVKILLIPVGVGFFYYFVTANLTTIATAIGFPSFSNRLSLEFTGGVYGLYLVGGYLIKRMSTRILQFKASHDFFIPSLLIVSIITFILTVLFQLWNYSQGQIYNVYYNFSLLFICSICLFTALTTITGHIHLSSFWNKISLASMGIYYIHNLVLIAIEKYDFLHINSLIQARPLRVLIVFLLAFIISFFLEELISRFPTISKFLFLRKPRS